MMSPNKLLLITHRDLRVAFSIVLGVGDRRLGRTRRRLVGASLSEKELIFLIRHFQPRKLDRVWKNAWSWSLRLTLGFFTAWYMSSVPSPAGDFPDHFRSR